MRLESKTGMGFRCKLGLGLLPGMGFRWRSRMGLKLRPGLGWG